MSIVCSAVWIITKAFIVLQWRHNGHDSVSNHQPHECLLNRLFRRRSKKTSKLRVTVLCVGNSPWTGEFPAQMASDAANVSIWWRHHGSPMILCLWDLDKMLAYQWDPAVIPVNLVVQIGHKFLTIRAGSETVHNQEKLRKSISSI